MICEQQQKTNMLLPLEGSADLKPHQEKSSPPVPTESSEADRLNRNRKMREWRIKNPEKYKANVLRSRNRNPERYKRQNQSAYQRRKQRDPDKIRADACERNRKYRALNREKLKEYWRVRYYSSPRKKELSKAFALKMRANLKLTETPEQLALRKQKAWPVEKARRSRKYFNDPGYRMARVLRARLSDALKARKINKSNKTMALLGCSREALVNHIESKWLPGMNWSNYGNGIGRWNLDHVKPCTAFQLELESEQAACFHYTNIRPAWWIDNLGKSSHWNGKHWRHADHACPPTPAA